MDIHLLKGRIDCTIPHGCGCGCLRVSVSPPLCNSITTISCVIFRYFSICTRNMLGVRRENMDVWERRAPLSPADVSTLVQEGVGVIVQPCRRRVYSDEEYEMSGARVQEDLGDASLILGVKEVPSSDLLPQKTFAFFSHTIKAQKENMDMLDAVLEKSVCLLDYELMVDYSGRRMGGVFGEFAGMAGLISLLHGLGMRLLALGFNNPFLRIAPCQVYTDVEEARAQIRTLRLDSFLESFQPIVFVFTGTGSVSKGARSIFRELPHEMISVEELPQIHRQTKIRQQLYGCVVSRRDHLIRKEAGVFSENEANLYPDRYTSCFNTKIAPYASCIINGIFWSPDSPRLLTRQDVRILTGSREDKPLTGEDGVQVNTVYDRMPSKGKQYKKLGLLAICDISADPGGSIEFMMSCTTLDNPFYLYNPGEDSEKNSLAGEGILMCTVDKLPSLMPREATDQFSSSLLPLVPDMLKIDAAQTMDEDRCNPCLKKAIIARNGHLTAEYEYIDKLRQKLDQE